MIGTQLVFAGPMCMEVFIESDSAAHMCMGGPAYRAACALLALRAQATVVATTPQLMPASCLDKYDKSGVRIYQQTVSRGPENTMIFDLRGAGNEETRVSSLGRPARPPIECLRQLPLRGMHVHVSVADGPVALDVLTTLRAAHSIASLSCQLDPHMVRQDRDVLLDTIRLCDIIFLQAREHEYLRREGLLGKVLASRLAVIMDVDTSAMVLVDAIPYFAQTPGGGEFVSSIGAEDVFAAGFLAELTTSRSLERAVVIGCELARASCGDYGPEAVLRKRHTVGALRHERLYATPTMALRAEQRAPVSYERVVEATGLFVVRDGKFLCVHKPNEKAFVPGVLYIPGGKLEPGESPEQSARRELMEETGLEGTLKPFGVVTYPHPTKNVLYRFYQFLVTGTQGTPVAQDDIVSWEWRAPETLRRDEVFELTWAQLELARMLGLW